MDRVSAETAPPSPAERARRHDLDWIRVLAFWLLIAFHIAIGFVDWGLYGVQNDTTAGPGLEFALELIHQWRLPALFMISGMGTSFALRRRTGGQFVRERFRRLVIPLVFGMTIINLPIAWIANSSPVSLAEHAWSWIAELGWLEKAPSLWLPAGAFHLWFIINLFVYSLIAAPLFLHARNRPEGAVMRTVRATIRRWGGWGLLLLAPLPLIAVELLIKPFWFGFTGQGFEFFWYLVFFAAGYLLTLAGDAYREALTAARFRSLALAAAASTILFGLRAVAESIEPGYGDLVLYGGWVPEGDSFWNPITFTASIAHALNSWAWCLVIFSWGARHLARPHRLLPYLNRSVYPFYVTHLSLVFAGLVVARAWSLWWPVELALTTVFVFAGCWLVSKPSSAPASPGRCSASSPSPPATDAILACQPAGESRAGASVARCAPAAAAHRLKADGGDVS